jgi:hypothetical protein
MLLIHLDTQQILFYHPLGFQIFSHHEVRQGLALNNYFLASMSARNATISDFKIPVEIILECLLCVARPRTPDTEKQWGEVLPSVNFGPFRRG